MAWTFFDNFGQKRMLAVNGTYVGQELAYVENTGITTVSATTEAGATTVVTAPAVTFDGVAKVLIEFFAPTSQINAANANTLNVYLYQDGVSIGYLASYVSTLAASGVIGMPLTGKRELTPSAGSHTYSIRAAASPAATGTQISGGVGGIGALEPAFIRITRAA